MVMDILSRLIERVVGKKKLDTYQVNGATSIAHLMYANDILIFSNANSKSLFSFKSILEEFSLYSGLELNTSKSSAIFSKVCEDSAEL